MSGVVTGYEDFETFDIAPPPRSPAFATANLPHWIALRPRDADVRTGETVIPPWQGRPMHAGAEHATHPEDLSRLVVERLNAGDVDGLTALYEPDAVLALPDGRVATGSDEIRRAYQRLVADRPQFEPGRQQPTLISGDLALTSSRLANGAVTVEVARRQPDGTWLWVLDQPNILS
jgi:ketosteroid isomerase-like protein